jgi:hypothetical protein
MFHPVRRYTRHRRGWRTPSHGTIPAETFAKRYEGKQSRWPCWLKIPRFGDSRQPPHGSLSWRLHCRLPAGLLRHAMEPDAAPGSDWGCGASVMNRPCPLEDANQVAVDQFVQLIALSQYGLMSLSRKTTLAFRPDRARRHQFSRSGCPRRGGALSQSSWSPSRMSDPRGNSAINCIDAKKLGCICKMTSQSDACFAPLHFDPLGRCPLAISTVAVQHEDGSRIGCCWGESGHWPLIYVQR